MKPKALEPNNELWIWSDERVTWSAGRQHPRLTYPTIRSEGFYILGLSQNNRD